MKFATSAALILLSLTGCGGGGSSTPEAPPAQAAPEITLSSAPAALIASGPAVGLEAKLSLPGTVNWSLAPGAPGTLSAASGERVSYLPPPSVPGVAEVTVTASAGVSHKSTTFKIYPNPGPSGIAIVAGASGTKDVVDGTGNSARLSQIAGMAPDANGNIWLVDDSALRLVTAAGAVSTLTDFRKRYDDGAATGYFPQMLSLAVANDGNPVVLWTWLRTSTVSKVGSDGVKHDIASISGETELPRTLLAAGGGQFYIVYRDHIARIAADGSISTLASGFKDIADAAADSNGMIYLADNGTVRTVAPDGTIGVLAGPTSKVHSPRSVTLDAAGNLLILDRSTADAKAYAVLRFTPAGQTSTVLQANDPVTGGAASLLRVTKDGSVLLGAGSRLDRVVAGSVEALAGLEDDTVADVDGQASTARFLQPQYLASDAANNLYVIDSGYKLRKIAADGQVTTLLNQKLGTACGLAATSDGMVYTAMRGDTPLGAAIYRVTTPNAAELIAGQPLTAPSVKDGTGIEARFAAPCVDGIDKQGNIIVHDTDPATGAEVWRKVTTGGTVSTLASVANAEFQMLAWDGLNYSVNLYGQVVRKNADGTQTVITNGSFGATQPGPLPGRLKVTTGSLPLFGPVPYGPFALAVISGSTVLKIVLPH